MAQDALRKQIEYINNSLINLREAAQEDFDLLAAEEKAKSGAVFVDLEESQPENLSIGSEVDMFRIVVSGYATQIAGYARVVEDVEEAQTKLKRFRIFGRLYFSAWYLSEAKNYPRLKQYVERVDYLRLLVMQYIELYQG